ncbi:hypothetical protein [Metallosphaera hakonensis]|nr:hypothetical protein [Metallosphaera hakonensis]
MITDKLLSDAKFYGKLIGMLFDKEDLVSSKIKGTALERRLTLINVDPEEYPDYLIRLTRGLIPTLSVITPNLDLVAIIESSNVEYMITSLKDVVSEYSSGKINPVRIPEYAPEPMEASEASIYEAINRVVDREPADFRVIELVESIAKGEKRYSSITKYINPLDQISLYYLGRGELKGNFAIYEAVKAIKGENSDIEDYISEGRVFRSSRKENWGLLTDEAIVGYALLIRYLREGNDSDLNQAIKIKEFIKSNLETEKGFRDVVPKDPLTNIVYLEPLANAEAAVFLSALWQATEDEEAKGMTYKALGIAAVKSGYLAVSARIAHALLRLNHGIKTSVPGKYDDVRVMFNKKVECKFKQGDKCSDNLEEFHGLGLEE